MPEQTNDHIDDRTVPQSPVLAAQAQVAAARQRRMALETEGRLPPSGPSLRPLPSMQFPGYDVIREVHRGGQGIVYQAVQDATNRKVAIKVLLEGAYASKAAHQRFDREIELVASLRHPNVISIFHSGETRESLRFCVMDYVRGLPLIRYVRDNQVTLHDALTLFIKVCEGVNHAHLKGVIHRDLKPSNILVDFEGIPKVLDFGLAKLVGGPEHSLVSMTGQVVGTLPYMSPEQTRGNPDEIDTRTDVYALGVLLYEMLTGHYPYPVNGPMADVMRHIVSTEPTPPSRAWTADSGIFTGKLHSRIRAFKPFARRHLVSPIDDELQTIVLKALSKERERRYQSAGELARDIQHYLANEPIEAKRDSALYMLGKQFRRYKAAAISMAVVFVVLVAGVIVSTTFYLRADQALMQQEQERLRAESVSGFLEEVLTLADPTKTKGAKLTVREALDRAATRVNDGALGQQPLVEADIRYTLGSTYFALGLYPQAETQLQAARAIQARELGDEHPGILATRSKLVQCFAWRGDYPEAAALARPTLELQRRVLGENHPDTLRTLSYFGNALGLCEQDDEAERYLRQALAGQIATIGKEHEDTIETMLYLSWHVARPASYSEEGLSLALDAYEIALRKLGPDHPHTSWAMQLVGLAYGNSTRYTEAALWQRQALETTRRVFGDEHHRTADCMADLGFALRQLGNSDDALTFSRQAVEIARRTYGPGTHWTVRYQKSWAENLMQANRHEEAAHVLSTAIAESRQVLGFEHFETLNVLAEYARLLMKLDRNTEALPYANEAYETSRRTFGPAYSHTNGFAKRYTYLLWKLDRRDESNAIREDCVKACRSTFGPHDPRTMSELSMWANTIYERGQLTEAESLAREAVEAYRMVAPAFKKSRSNPLNVLATILTAQGRTEEALPLYEELLAVKEFLPGELRRRGFARKYADVLWKVGRKDDATSVLHKNLNECRQALGLDHAQTLWELNAGAWFLYQRGQLAEAEGLARDSVAGYRRTLESPDKAMVNALDTLALAVRDLAHLDEALLLYEEIQQAYAAETSNLGPRDSGIWLGHAECLLRMKRFAEAERELLANYESVTAVAVPNQKARDPLKEAAVRLYEAWHVAEPDKGHNAKVAEWQLKMREAAVK